MISWSIKWIPYLVVATIGMSSISLAVEVHTDNANQTQSESAKAPSDWDLKAHSDAQVNLKTPPKPAAPSMRIDPKDKDAVAPSSPLFFLTFATIILSLGLSCYAFLLRRSIFKLSERLAQVESEIEKFKSEASKAAERKPIASEPRQEPVAPQSEPGADSITSSLFNAPSPFPKGYIGAGEALQRTRKKMPKVINHAAELMEAGILPLVGWGADQKVLVLPKEAETQKWFFIGDIHGDFLALHRLLEKIRSNEDFRICFLGDLVDRGPHNLECFALILETAIDYPDRFMWIVGNHDVALTFNREKAKFDSGVNPAEIVDLLNTPPEWIGAASAEKWGKLFIDIVRGLPRAALFPDGLLATHGGIPLEDRWAELKTLADLESPVCLGDFTWTRASNMPVKTEWQDDPAKRQRSHDFEYGYKDLEGFCKSVASFFPVKRVVRGHDHVENGWDLPKKYKNIPILTINGFGFHYLSGSYEKYAEKLVLGVYSKDQLPTQDFAPFFAKEHGDVLSMKDHLAT